MRILPTGSTLPARALVGVGGIGTGSFFALDGPHTLGRNESRPARLLDIRDYCKLHIITHYIARLLSAKPGTDSFQVFPIGKVGADPAGETLLHEMQQAGLNTRFVSSVPDRPTLTSVCFQYPDGSGGNITTSNSAAAELTLEDVDTAFAEAASLGPLIALSAPEVPLPIRHHFLCEATKARAFRAASFVSAEIAIAKELGSLNLIDLLALNESEAAEFVGCKFSPDNPDRFIHESVSHLNEHYPSLRLVVSVGKRGAYGFERGRWEFCPAPVVQIASTAGAGDALLGGILAAMVGGMPFIHPAPGESDAFISSALHFGVMLASYSVTSPHTIHPDASLDNMLKFLRELGIGIASDFLATWTEQFRCAAPVRQTKS
jgi:sugar/nucleoside kinase (ribokinase family)